MDVFELHEAEFKQELAKRTNTGSVLKNVGRIYEYLGELFGQNCDDSVLREWTFQWYSVETDQPYDVIYHRWLNA